MAYHDSLWFHLSRLIFIMIGGILYQSTVEQIMKQQLRNGLIIEKGRKGLSEAWTCVDHENFLRTEYFEFHKQYAVDWRSFSSSSKQFGPKMTRGMKLPLLVQTHRNCFGQAICPDPIFGIPLRICTGQAKRETFHLPSCWKVVGMLWFLLGSQKLKNLVKDKHRNAFTVYTGDHPASSVSQ